MTDARTDALSVVEYCNGYDSYYIGVQSNTDKVLVYHLFNEHNPNYRLIELYQGTLNEDFIKDILDNGEEADCLDEIYSNSSIKYSDRYYDGYGDIVRAVANNEEHYREFMGKIHEIGGTESLVDYMLGYGKWNTPKRSLMAYLKSKHDVMEPDGEEYYGDAFVAECNNDFVAMCKLYDQYDFYDNPEDYAEDDD